MVEREKSKTSVMRKGMLHKLTRDEILDLTAYVNARCKKNHELFHNAGHDHNRRRRPDDPKPHQRPRMFQDAGLRPIPVFIDTFEDTDHEMESRWFHFRAFRTGRETYGAVTPSSRLTSLVVLP